MPNPLWEAVKAKAKSEGRTATDIAVAAFRGYVDGTLVVDAPGAVLRNTDAIAPPHPTAES